MGKTQTYSVKIWFLYPIWNYWVNKPCGGQPLIYGYIILNLSFLFKL